LLGYSPAVRQAAAALSSAAADEAAAERTERVGAAKVFFAALRASAVLAAREDALALAHAELNAAKTRYASGDAPHVDVIRAEVAVARAEADAETARADDANARDALQVETGTSDAALGATAPGALPLPPPLAGDPEGAVAAALQLRPEVIAAQRAADAAAAAIGSARVAALPPLTVGAGYATGVDSGQRVAGRVVSAQVSVPLPFGPAARVDQAKSAAAEANARLAGVKRSVALEVAAAARSLIAADRAAAATLRARQAAQAESNAVELGYRNGASSSLEVAEARSTYEQARVNELSAAYDAALADAIFDVEVGR